MRLCVERGSSTACSRTSVPWIQLRRTRLLCSLATRISTFSCSHTHAWKASALSAANARADGAPSSVPAGCSTKVGQRSIWNPSPVRCGPLRRERKSVHTSVGIARWKVGPTSCTPGIMISSHHTPCHACDQSANGCGKRVVRSAATHRSSRESTKASSSARVSGIRACPKPASSSSASTFGAVRTLRAAAVAAADVAASTSRRPRPRLARAGDACAVEAEGPPASSASYARRASLSESTACAAATALNCTASPPWSG